MEGKHREFYATSLKYLGCTELEDLTKEEQAKHAYFLALAAILGDKVWVLVIVLDFGMEWNGQYSY